MCGLRQIDNLTAAGARAEMASTVLLLAALPILSGAQWSSGGSLGARAAAGSDDDGAGAAAARAALADQHDRGAHVAGPPRAGMLNVRDFGAIGDGRHDDTVSIQRALLEAGRRAVSLGLSDCHPSEGRAENKSNIIWIIGIWILFLEVPSLAVTGVTIGYYPR